jgi:hypothetical protein
MPAARGGGQEQPAEQGSSVNSDSKPRSPNPSPGKPAVEPTLLVPPLANALAKR